MSVSLSDLFANEFSSPNLGYKEFLKEFLQKPQLWNSVLIVHVAKHFPSKQCCFEFLLDPSDDQNFSAQASCGARKRIVMKPRQ
jgi:hypothetical protein